MDDFVGSTIKGYSVEALIGSGSFGAVYQAFQPLIEREVAIKAVDSNHINRADFVRNFEAEARIVASLESLHIVPLYDFWREPDGAFLVMRYLRGGSLSKEIQRGTISLRRALAVMDQVSMALYVAHRSGVIHRDVKPANILMDEDRNAYLADFGIAITIESLKERSELDRLALGTPSYMAPEQFEGDRATVQSDLYSLGVVLYEMLTGERPFYHAKVSEIYKMHRYAPMPTLPLQQSAIPTGIVEILERALAKNPADRYQDALQITYELRRVVQNSGMTKITQTLPAIVADHDTLLFADAPSDGDSLSSSLVRQIEQGAVRNSTERTAELADPEADTATAMFSPISNPYKGLRAFREGDANDFFGRETAIRNLLAKMGKERFVAVVGASGSGKSSVVYAGLLPRLRGTFPSWYTAEMTPTATPFRELATALLRIARAPFPHLEDNLRLHVSMLAFNVDLILPQDSELLLVIDQFEECFSLLNDAEERNAWLQSLYFAVTAPNSRLRLLITLRADFYNQPLLERNFGDLLLKGTYVLQPLDRDEIEQAIVAPARRAGLHLEAGLTSTILHDLEDQQGALPLLQFTMSELYERRQGNNLTLEAYHNSGGVLAALATRADDAYTQLDAGDQARARRLFLRLVSVTDQVQDTRRRALWSELLHTDSDPKAVERVLEHFGKQRLLTFDHDPATREPTAMIAHEALIREWKTLREWISSSRDALRLERQLATAADEWRKAGEDHSYLAGGSRLVAFEDLAANKDVALSETARRYLQQSERQRRRQVDRLRLFVAVLVVFLILSLGAGGIALSQRNRADAEARVASSREIATNALMNVSRGDVGLLLSLEALNVTDTFEARNSLLTALQAQPHLQRQYYGHTDWVTDVVYSPDGRYAASAGRDGQVILWDMTTHTRHGAPLNGHTDGVWSLAFSPDSGEIASASGDGTVIVWDVASGMPVGEPITVSEDGVWSIAFDPAGEGFAVGGMDGTITVYDAVAHEAVNTWAAHDDTVFALAYSADGETLFSAGADLALRAWQPATAALTAEQLDTHDDWILALAVSDDGATIATGGADNLIRLWDSTTLAPVGSPLQGHTNWIRDLRFVNDSLVSASADGSARLWDVTTGEAVRTVFSGDDAVWGLAPAPDGETVLTGGASGRVLEWSLDEAATYGDAFASPAPVLSLALSEDGRLLAAGGGTPATDSDNTVRVWDVETGSLLHELTAHQGPVTALTFTDDHTLASISLDGRVILWDALAGSVIADPLAAQNGRFYAADFFAGGAEPLLATGGDNGIALWNTQTHEQYADMPFSEALVSLALRPDGNVIAAGYREGSVRLWDVAAGSVSGLRMTEDGDPVNAVAFSPDGDTIAAGSENGQIYLWQPDNPSLFQRLDGNASGVLSLQFSPDGALLATGGKDDQVILWDVATGRRLGQPLSGFSDWVNTVRFAADGETLTAGALDGRILRWTVSLDEWRELACQVANRNLLADEWSLYLPDMPFHETCTFSATLEQS
jgi:WD40 repeat protein/serine/threonine protein kinase/energy-coupling factor transporter ATP-binding protein EcfA2